MTSVRGPFVFTSDQWEDRFVTLAKGAGCGALALQLGSAPLHAADAIRNAGLQVIGWGICSPPGITAGWLGQMRPEVWMPQAESSAEFEALVECLMAHVFAGPIEPVMTAGGMETSIPNATEEQKRKERARRRDLLASFGVTKVWPEVYAQDADRSGQWWLGSVDWMCSFFRDAFGFKEAHPVIGLWDDVPVSRYSLSAHGRTFGCWRAEQMVDARYPEIAAVPETLEDLMAKIGTQHGIAAVIKRLKTLDPKGSNPNRDPNDLGTWGAWDKLERTLSMLVEDHDRRAA